MRADRYERERKKVRASKMPAHTKAARLALVDIKEERSLNRRIRAAERELGQLRKRREALGVEREARQRQQLRERMYRTWHREISRYDEISEGV